MSLNNSTTVRSHSPAHAPLPEPVPEPLARASTHAETHAADAAEPERATGVPAKLRAMRVGLGALAAVSPSLAARTIGRLWFSPPKRALSVDERAQLASGDRVPVTLDGRHVAAWSFGEGPIVMLVHGWGGRAGQMLPFVAPLVESGARVVVLDALGHGESSPSALGRRQASFLDVARCMEAVSEKVGMPEAIVAHSGGAIASTIALQRGTLAPSRLALLAPMTRPVLYAKRFDAMLHLSPELGQRWRDHAETRVGFAWADLDLTTAAARFPVPKALIVHDRRDKEVPFAEGEALADAWLEADFVATSGLGHQRILRDAAVVRRVVDFVRPT